MKVIDSRVLLWFGNVDPLRSPLKRLRQGTRKRIIWASFLGISMIIFPGSSHAITVGDVPNPRQVNNGWVTDMADILSDSTESQLNQMISELEAKNGTEITVVTVPETSPFPTPKEFTTELFNEWGIGKEGQDNGVLFLTSVGDRRVEIETGYGVEGILPDVKVGNIIETEITPRFKQRDFDGGILAGTKALIIELEGDRSIPIETSTESASFPWGIPFAGGAGLAAIAGAIAYSRSRHRVFLKPEGRSRLEHLPKSVDPFYCATCKKRMKKLDEATLSSKLSQAERAAQTLGSVRFEGWQCPQCSFKLTGQEFHLMAYVLDAENFTTCSTCEELTVTRTIQQVLEEPTWNKVGRQVVAEKCHCCDRAEEIVEEIPRLKLPSDAVSIEPIGRSRVTDSRGLSDTPESGRPTHCIQCRYPMEKLNDSLLYPLLKAPERVAQQLNSVQFIGWICPHCSDRNKGNLFHIRAYKQKLKSVLKCPTCQELTVKRSDRIVKQPTQHRSGKRLITDTCHCCGQTWHKEEIIPRLPPPPPPSRTHTTSSYSSSSSSWSGGGGSSGGGSSGGGSFGGGDSGGGGAGGSW